MLSFIVSYIISIFSYFISFTRYSFIISVSPLLLIISRFHDYIAYLFRNTAFFFIIFSSDFEPLDIFSHFHFFDFIAASFSPLSPILQIFLLRILFHYSFHFHFFISSFQRYFDIRLHSGFQISLIFFRFRLFSSDFIFAWFLIHCQLTAFAGFHADFQRYFQLSFSFHYFAFDISLADHWSSFLSRAIAFIFFST